MEFTSFVGRERELAEVEELLGLTRLLTLAGGVDRARPVSLCGLPLRFYRQAAKIIDVPWQRAAGADLAYSGVEGTRTRAGRIVGWYVGQVLRAATRDERVCLVLMRVTNLLAPPGAFFHPAVVARVLRQALAQRRWRARSTSAVGSSF